MATYIHPSATVATDAVLGDNKKPWQLVQIRPNVKISSQCILGRGVHVNAGVMMGNRVKVQNYVSVYDGITVEDGVFVRPNAVFTNDKVPRTVNPDGSLKEATDWKVAHTRFGEGSALGAIVTKDVPDYGIAAGKTARLISCVYKCGERLPEGVDPGTYECDPR